MNGYVPLSVRHGGRRKKLAWWWSGQREAVALRLAPWLNATSDDRRRLFAALDDVYYRALEDSEETPLRGYVLGRMGNVVRRLR